MSARVHKGAGLERYMRQYRNSIGRFNAIKNPVVKSAVVTGDWNLRDNRLKKKVRRDPVHMYWLKRQLLISLQPVEKPKKKRVVRKKATTRA